MALSLYVHVPFCRSRCAYCAFYSGEPLPRLATYVDLLLAELDLRASATPAGPVTTVYFGGGTPSLLSPDSVARLLARVDRRWGLAPDAEVTLEANPGAEVDFTGLAAAGVNRASIGVQLLSDPWLTRLGRGHRAADALACLRRAARAGLRSVSADLLFGLPGVDPADLARCAARLLEAGVDHVSTYSLELHPATPLAEDAACGRFQPASPEEEDAQWSALDEALSSAGCRAYEVSNYALPGRKCAHNAVYWARGPYLGLGPGAHAFAPEAAPWGLRSWNAPNLDAYADALARGCRPPGGSETLSAPEALLETLFLATRTSEPLVVASLACAFGLDPQRARIPFEDARRSGLLRVPPEDPLAYAVTPDGLRLADGLAAWLHRRLWPGDEEQTRGAP